MCTTGGRAERSDNFKRIPPSEISQTKQVKGHSPFPGSNLTKDVLPSCSRFSERRSTAVLFFTVSMLKVCHGAFNVALPISKQLSLHFSVQQHFQELLRPISRGILIVVAAFNHTASITRSICWPWEF
jgi:hypothetical protein